MEIKIEKPCSENWEGMTPDDTGRFCSVCTKSVHDFTAKPKEELLQFLLCSTQSPCIRMLASQERFTPVEVQTTAQKILRSGKAIPAAALALVMLLASSCEPSGAEHSSTQNTNIQALTRGDTVLTPQSPLTGAVQPSCLGDSLGTDSLETLKGEAPAIQFGKPLPPKRKAGKTSAALPEPQVSMGPPPEVLRRDYSERKMDGPLLDE